MTIDEEMYDAPALAKELCENTGYSQPVLLESNEGKSTYTCE